MLTFTGFELWGGTTWTDLLFAAQDQTDAASNLISATSNRLYIGLDRRFDGVLLVLGTAGSYTGVTFQYWNGSAWTNLPTRQTYAFTGNGGVIRFLIPSAWTTRTLASVESSNTGLSTDDQTTTAKYWIRVNVTGVTTTATLSWALPFPEYSYTTPSFVRRFMQLPTAFFTSTTIPSEQDVADAIRRVESQIDKYTWKSWKPNHDPSVNAENTEQYDFNRFGFTLENYPILYMISLAIWNGSAFEVMSQGRGNDYSIDNRLGLVSFTRLIHLPFAYTRSAIYTWGYGEFKLAVQVNYVWGRDLDFDRFGPLITKVANQLVSVDLVRSHDYSSFVVTGPDKIALERKAEMWEAEALRTMDELRGIQMWIP